MKEYKHHSYKHTCCIMSLPVLDCPIAGTTDSPVPLLPCTGGICPLALVVVWPAFIDAGGVVGVAAMFPPAVDVGAGDAGACVGPVGNPYKS